LTSWASEVVIVGTDGLSGLVLRLQPAATLVGRVVFDEGPAGMPDLRALRVALDSVDGGDSPGDALVPEPVAVAADGRVEVSGVLPGRYQLRVESVSESQPDWSLRSVVLNGEDLTDTALVVEGAEHTVGGVVVGLSRRSTSLSGTLQGVNAEPATALQVVVFAANSRYWTPGSRRIAVTQPDTVGRFLFRNLPPGQYRLAVIVRTETDVRDAAFLTRLVPMSVEVQVAEGAHVIQDLRLQR
jgi:hypothetical protein